MGRSLDDTIWLNSLDGQIKTLGVYGYELAKIMSDIGYRLAECDRSYKKVGVLADVGARSRWYWCG